MKSLKLLNCLILAIAISSVFQSQQAVGKQANKKQSVSTQAKDLLAQSNNTSVVKITGVKIKNTDNGLEITLETANAKDLQPVGKNEDNSLIVDIPNAELDLADGEEFTLENPGEGIAAVKVIEVDDKNIRLTVTGESGVPKVKLFESSQGLIFALTPVKSTTIEPDKPETPKPPTTDETQTQTSTEDNRPIELIVTDDRDSYTVPNATTGTRTDTPLRDVPQSIQVVPKRIIEEQGTSNLSDALRNVSGVQQYNADSRGYRFQVRGFDNAAVLRNGFNTTVAGEGNFGYPELGNVERVEVLKGPAAVLFGTNQPGGVINIVTEKPLSEPYYEFGLKLGNRSFFEPSFDISGPLTEDGSLLYRLNAVYRTDEVAQNFDNNIERFFIAPSITWKISDRTDITLNVEYYHDERPSTFGFPAIGDRVADVPFDRVLGEPDDLTTVESFRAGYELEHRFSDNWKVRNIFSCISFNPDLRVFFPVNLDENTGTQVRTYAITQQPVDSYEVQTNVIGEFNTGSVKHKVLFGADLRSRDARNLSLINPRNLSFFNIFNPVYGAVQRPDIDDIPVFGDTDNITDFFGVYLQDQVTLSPNFKLLAGIRYDTVDQKVINNLAGTETNQSDSAVSPRFGIVYQPIQEISLYGSYSQSFVPNSALTVDGDTLEPETGEQFEVGIRGEFLEGKLTTNLAVFNIVKDNVAAPDPNDPTNTFSIPVGQQRSRGVELDIIGNISPGWNVVANYAFIDAEVTRDTINNLEGNQLFSAPRHSANLWTNYTIQSGSLQGLGLGIGVNYVGERFGDLENSFKVDSYFLTNAVVSYEKDNWKAALNFRNLFDVDYIIGTNNSRDFRIFPGQGFSVIGSISVKF